jgi:hypothetical protein
MRRLPSILLAVSVVLTSSAFVFVALAGGGVSGPAEVYDAMNAVLLLSFPAVGALVATRHPRNAIGWLFCAAGVLFGLSSAAYGYALTDFGGADYAAWLNAWIFLPALFGIPPLLFLLFPDGRLLSARWRGAVWLTGIAMAGFAAAAALRPGVLDDAPVAGVVNPLGVRGAGDIVDAVAAVAGSCALLAILLSVAALVLRLRRSRGAERRQMKWFAAAAALFAATCVAFISVPVSDQIGQLAILTAYALIPVAAGVAILRHRLYDIDVVIRRTLIYAVLTATLGATYLALVLLVGLAVGESGLAVAVSTLAVAAMFRPALTRIQAVVDRRFYRSRYDAALTLEAFGSRLRDEVDLEALTDDLRGVVSETVQPAHVSVWLR